MKCLQGFYLLLLFLVSHEFIRSIDTMKGVSCQKELKPFVGKIVLFCANFYFSRLLKRDTYRIKNKNWLELEAAFIDVTFYGNHDDDNPWSWGGYPMRRLLNKDAVEKEAYVSNNLMRGMAGLVMREPTYEELKQIVEALDGNKAKLEFMETCKDAFQKALQLPSSEVLSTRLCFLEDKYPGYNLPLYKTTPFKQAVYDLMNQTDLVKKLGNQKWSDVANLVDSAINDLEKSNNKSASHIKLHKAYIIDAILSGEVQQEALNYNCCEDERLKCRERIQLRHHILRTRGKSGL